MVILALNKLKAIETNGKRIAVNLLIVLDVSVYFIHEEFVRYLSEGRRSVLGDCMNILIGRANILSA